VFKLINPDLIHIMHFVNWPLSVIEQAIQSGRPVVMSFHDYYAITPHYTMQGEKDSSQTTTPAYAVKLFGKDISPYLLQRRSIITSALGRAKALAVPSPYLARVLGQIFPFDFKVIEYGIRPFTPQKVIKNWTGLRFGYLGSLLPQKGWESLFTAFQKIAPIYPQAELHFFGGMDKAAPVSPGIFFHGIFEQSDLPQILPHLDVGIIPSVFAETYSLVLSEMWQAGLPVAVSNIGAMGERVTDGVNGRKFEPGNISQIAEVLTWFLEQDDWRMWPVPNVRLDLEMASEYDTWYQNALRN